MSQTFSKISDSTFSHNVGSLYVLNSNLSFNGLTLFENCAEPPNKGAIGEVLIYQEGGAITSFLSRIHFNGRVNLFRNQAKLGGAVLASESTITVHGKAIQQSMDLEEDSLYTKAIL